MTARFQDIKMGYDIGEGLDVNINNVEKALRNVGIPIRDTANEFRDMQDVISDLSKKWNDLGETEQANIIKQFAGIRQREQFIVLMEQQANIEKALGIETEATGLAQKRYADYLNGVEAAQNKAQVSLERLWMTSINSDFVKLFYNMGGAVADFATAIGGLPTIITVVGVTYLAFSQGVAISSALATASMSSLALGAYDLAVAFDALLATNPLGLIAIGLSAVIIGINLFTQSAEEASRAAQKLNDELTNINRTLGNLNREKAQLFELSDSLSKAKKGSEEWYSIQQKIKDILPNVNGYYDEQGRFILDNSVNLAKLIDLKEQEIALEEKKLQNKSKEASDAEIKSYDELIKKRKYYIDILNGSIRGSQYADKNKIQGQLDDINLSIADSEIKLQSYFLTLSKSEQDAMLNATKGTEVYQKLLDAMNATMDVGSKTGESGKERDYILPPKELPAEIMPTASEESKKALDEILKEVVDMIKQETKMQIDAIKDQLAAEKQLYEQKKQDLQDIYDAEKRQREETKIALQRELEDEKNVWSERKQAIKDELDGYKSKIDAQEELLRAKHAEADYESSRADNNKKLADIESQILALSFDNSAEGIAKKKALEEEAANLKKDMSKEAADHELDLQLKALEAEKKAAEEKAAMRIKELEEEQAKAEQEYEMRLRALEDEQRNSDYMLEYNKRILDDEYAAVEAQANDKIKVLQNYLDQEGTIVNDAMKMITDKNSNVYQQLLDWNTKYGTGINDTIISNWKLATDAIQEYINKINEIPDLSSGGTDKESWGGIGSHHSGVYSGFVGGSSSSKTSEVFAKLMKGELVINPTQMNNFVTKILPSMTNSPSVESNMTSGIKFDKAVQINVAGNLDKNILPKIEDIIQRTIKELNSTMLNRGFTRNANSFSI